MSENTCNALLTEELRKKGLQAFFEKHFTTLEGLKKPDIFVTKDGYYFIEGKQRPAQLIHAVSKAHVYRESTRSTVSPKAVFGVLYPEDCNGPCEVAVLLDRAPYYIEHRAKSLQELANWIQEFIVTPVIPAEINTNHAIRLLNQAVDSINFAFAKLDVREIDEIFGGKMFFETVLGYEEEDKVPAQHLRVAAAYLLVNQILFYQVLARETKDYDILDSEKLNHPAELQTTFFAKVLVKDYRPIFDFDVSSRLKGSDALDAIKITINAINALAPEKHGHDILGKIFHNLIPFEIRKSVAAFFTNSEAAEMLATLAIEDPDTKVIDPAVGSGTLLVASYRRKKELMERVKKKKFGSADHKKFVEEQITGIDIMPFAAHLAAVHLALQAPLYSTDNVRIAIHDSTNLAPGKSIEAAHETFKEAFKTARISDYFGEVKEDKRRKVIRGTVELSNQQNAKPILLESADVVIMNPPFTRAERLHEDYKKLLLERFDDYRKLTFGKVGLHIFFIFLADKFVKKDGKIALVLPATVLRIPSMKGPRSILAKNYHIEYIITTFERAAFSEAAQFREILLVAKKVKELKDRSEVSDDLKTAVVILKRLPSNASEAREFGQLIKQTLLKLDIGKEFENDNLTIRTINQGTLKDMVNNMFPLISVSDQNVLRIWDELRHKAKEKLIKCGDYFDKNKADAYEDVYIPPYNSTFILTDEKRALKEHDRWIATKIKKDSFDAQDRFSHVKITVPLKVIEHGFRRPAGMPYLDVSNNLDYIVVNKFEDAEKIFPDQKQAKKALATISKWKKIVDMKKANLLLSRRFDLSAPGTRLLAFYTNKPAFGVDMWSVKGVNDEDAKILCLWYNSIVNLLQLIIYRTETRGAWLKLHEYQIRDSYILNLKSLSKRERTSLLQLFDGLYDQEFPSTTDQLRKRNSLKLKIDKTILEILGFSPTEAEQIISKLYLSLAEEIQKLKTLMEG